MNISIRKESATIPNRTENLQQGGINVTNFLNFKGPKNIKQKIFDLLATGKGKLEIKNQTISLSISNLYEREKFYSEFQQNQ